MLCLPLQEDRKSSHDSSHPDNFQESSSDSDDKPLSAIKEELTGTPKKVWW